MNPVTNSGGHPALSVIIASFNRWPLSLMAVASVLSQTCADLEVVVVDDGSDDGTSERLQSIQDNRLTVISQENTERGAAFNTGVRVARGRYVNFLGDDDIQLPFHAEQFRLASESCGHPLILGAGAWLWDPLRDRRRRIRTVAPRRFRQASLLKTVVPPAGLFVDRLLFQRVGGFPEERQFVGAEDWVLLVRLSKVAALTTLPRPSVLIREHAGRTVNQVHRIEEAKNNAVDAILSGDLDVGGVTPREANLLCSGLALYRASAAYGNGDTRATRQHLREARQGLDLSTALRETARLRVQTVAGPSGARALRKVRQLYAAR